ncbi:prolipoprotein diacylglyceryl transferase family protein [Paenibacillus sp. SN-8-1]|uniref:prolipoprotein diacylglyceryl transferase family protein n=1 Tax=Paenibacillus sp. SN-8-1 TaxID=3435409 RepID=UPI003D9A8AA6
MKNELLHIGPLTIYGYGLMIGIGIIAGYQVLVRPAERRLVEQRHIFSIYTAVVKVVRGLYQSRSSWTVSAFKHSKFVTIR